VLQLLNIYNLWNWNKINKIKIIILRM